MTGEMNTLRNKRIDLLKGMQGKDLSCINLATFEVRVTTTVTNYRNQFNSCCRTHTFYEILK